MVTKRKAIVPCINFEKDIKLIDQVELSVDLLIQQLVELKNHCLNLRGKLAGVSTPALGNGDARYLTDEQLAEVWNARMRTILRRQIKPNKKKAK